MNNLRLLREQKNKTQIEIANELNIPRTNYSRYESGAGEPKIEILIQLANYFNTTIDYILGRESNIIDLNSFPDYKKDLIKIIIKLPQDECKQTNAFFKGLTPELCKQLEKEVHNKDLENKATIEAIKDAEILNNFNQNKGIK